MPNIEQGSRLFHPVSNNTLIVAVDGSLIDGPKRGLRRMDRTLTEVAENGATAVLGFRGTLTTYADILQNTARIENITASTSGLNHTRKVLVGSVNGAKRRGMDAVSVHVNVTSIHEPQMLETLGRISERCEKTGMPLIMHMYPRSERSDGQDENYASLDPREYARYVRHAVRIGAELQPTTVPTIIKAQYTPRFQSVVESALEVPVVMAGGPRGDIEAFLNRTYEVMDQGARGVAVGRNVYDHRTPGKVVHALALVIHEGKSPRKAMKLAKL